MIQLELKKHKDPHFKHVYVFHHQTQRRFPIVTVSVLFLFLAVGAAYVWQPQWFHTTYTQLMTQFAATPAENTPATTPEAEIAPPPLSVEGTTLPPLSPEIQALLAHNRSSSDAAPIIAPPQDVPQPQIPPPEIVAPTATTSSPVVAETAEIMHKQDMPEHDVPEADTPTLPPQVLPAAVQTMIDEAMNYIAQGQLHTPEGKNAINSYKKLNVSAPEAAPRVLDSIMFQYLQQISSIAEGGDHALATQLYQHAYNLAPQHQAIEGLRQVMAEALMSRAETQASRGNLSGKDDSVTELYQQIKALNPSAEIMYPLENRLLTALANKGAEHIRRKRYTTPENGNAYDTYQLMLRLVPGNNQAQQGLQQIADKYHQMASAEIRKGNRRRALEFIERGLSVQPNDKALLLLQTNMQRDQNSGNPANNNILSLSDQEKYTLINRALQHIAAGRLSTPAGNNAYEIYQRILQHDPDNEDALKGLREIANTYAQIAKVEHAKGNRTEAQQLLANGLKVLPDHPELLSLKTQTGF
jgi:tetratricopeptide (TPR) repeat protein